jgi:hypothetical protein
MSLKNPVTRPGIDPGTVRLVAQRLNHYATPDPFFPMYGRFIVFFYSSCQMRALLFSLSMWTLPRFYIFLENLYNGLGALLM